MARVVLNRRTSTWIHRGEPKKRKGNNTPTLGLSNNNEKTRYVYVTFSIPRAALDPRNVLESAVLQVHNAQKWDGSVTLTASRISEKWAASRLTWNTRPSATGSETLTRSNVAKRGVWNIDVKALVDQMRGGALNLGFRIAINRNGNYSISNRGRYAPQLLLRYYVRPGVPTALSPSDQTVVSVAKPTVMVVNAEINESGITGVQVQQSATSNWSNPDWDSGAVSTTSPSLNLASYSASKPVAENGEMYWRIRIRGHGNVWSSWSAGARYVRQSLGQVTITYPPTDGVELSDPTPPLDWEFTGGSGTQSAYRARLHWRNKDNTDTGVVLWDSGLQAASGTSFGNASLPDYVIVPLGDYLEWEVRVWDNADRVTTLGGPEYVSARRRFRYVLGSGVDPVNSLEVVPMPGKPFVKLEWNRSEPPDEYIIVRDGVEVAKITGPDLMTDAGGYEYIDVTAPPRTDHEWTVRCVVNGVTSPGNPTTFGRAEGHGIWLSDPANDVWVALIEPEPDMAHTEEGATHRALHARTPVRVTTSLHGYSGRVTGELYKTDLTGEKTGSELFDEFMQVREDYTGRRMYLSMNDLAFPVIVFDMTAAPTGEPGDNGDYLYTAGFSFFEVRDVQ